MHVIAHEYVRVHRAPSADGRFAEALQVEPLFRIAEKASAPVIAALDDVLRNAG